MNHLDGVYVIRELVGYTPTFFTYLFALTPIIIGALITLCLIAKDYGDIKMFLPVIAGCVTGILLAILDVCSKPYPQYEIKINNEVSKVEFDETYETIEDKGQNVYIVKFKD